MVERVIAVLSTLLVTLALLLCLCGPAFPFGVMLGQRAVATGSGPGPTPTYLLEEDFEGSGLPTDWTESGTATRDYDYATSPAPLEGSESAYLGLTSSNAGIVSPDIGDLQPTLYTAFMYHSINLPSFTSNFFLLASSGLTRGLINITSAGALSCTAYGGTASTSSSGVISEGVTTYVKVLSQAGSGSDAVLRVWTSTDGSSWGSPVCDSTNGTITTGWDQTTWMMNGSAAEAIIDDVRLDDEDINY